MTVEATREFLTGEFMVHTDPPPRRRAGRGHRASDRERQRGAIIGPRWKFLAEASEILDSSLEYQETIANVAPGVAEAAAGGFSGDLGGTGPVPS